MTLFIEQCLNGLQFGLLLFLLAAGLTLVFGIMDLVNLAHGSLYMIGAYFAATFAAWTGSFVLGAVLALGATLIVGMAVEVIVMRWLNGPVQILPGVNYSAYRLSIIAVTLTVAIFLYVLVMRTRVGMLIRAGAS